MTIGRPLFSTLSAFSAKGGVGFSEVGSSYSDDNVTGGAGR